MIKRISVLIPCYNAEKFLYDALDSIRKQSYANFEAIIIDDGSKDKSADIYRAFAEKDQRFKVLVNEQNSGVSFSLNRGIEAAEGDYIARMDADDISAPNRLEKQFEFLEQNPDISLIGVKADLIDDAGKKIQNSNNMYFEANTLSFSTYFTQPFYGGSIMGKASLFKENKFRLNTVSEDYEFCLQAVSQNYRLTNLNESLYYYRKNPVSISNSNSKGQELSHNDTSARYLSLLWNKKLNKTEVDIINNRPFKPVNKKNFKNALSLFYETFEKLQVNKTKEIMAYCTRHKIDIAIQSLKKTTDFSDKVYISGFLIALLFNIDGISYFLKKLH